MAKKRQVEVALLALCDSVAALRDLHRLSRSVATTLEDNQDQGEDDGEEKAT